jgi:predicted O-linked N-acetylglucosamine transferase (SPINDLY family)
VIRVTLWRSAAPRFPAVADRRARSAGTVALANDWPRPAALRRELRGRLERSPLMDGRRFAASLEAAYRGAWRDCCERV